MHRPNGRANMLCSGGLPNRTARNAGSRPHLAFGFQPVQKTPTIHARSGLRVNRENPYITLPLVRVRIYFDRHRIVAGIGRSILARLVVVSNRVGVPDKGERAGGLEVAIRPTLKRRGGVWFGLPSFSRYPLIRAQRRSSISRPRRPWPIRRDNTFTSPRRLRRRRGPKTTKLPCCSGSAARRWRA